MILAASFSTWVIAIGILAVLIEIVRSFGVK